MKKIIISEKAEKLLFEYLLNENYDLSSKIELVKNYLDKNYIKADTDVLNKDNDMEKQYYVIMLDTNKQPSKHVLTLKQLFEKLQYKYQRILTDKNERDKFLWQIVNDWYFKKTSKNNSLSNTKY